MSYGHGGWAPYVPVAERRRKAERAMEKLRRGGHPVAPVTIAGRVIASTFWGRAWCDNIESYHDYESRLPRGRTYARNGSVVDLQIAPGRVEALVSGSELYKVVVTVKEAAKAQWRSICAACAGTISSLVELLQGRFSKAVMKRLCKQESGLFPRSSEIRFSCSCPDHAAMCKHVAAVLYGVGARLDHQPELLFRLRSVDEADLVTRVDAFSPLSKAAPAGKKRLENDDVSALFGLDMAEPAVLPVRKASPAKASVAAKPPAPAEVEADVPIWKESWGRPAEPKLSVVGRKPAVQKPAVQKKAAEKLAVGKKLNGPKADGRKSREKSAKASAAAASL